MRRGELQLYLFGGLGYAAGEAAVDTGHTRV